MLDFNHRSICDELNQILDKGIVEFKAKHEHSRTYLGGSRVGVACQRALQYEFFNTPKDPDKGFNGRTYRIFEVGHALEDLAIGWFLYAGFDLRNKKKSGEQFGFETANGLIQGHIDGVFCGGPGTIAYPSLWECKTMKDDKWKKCAKEKLRKANPVYFAQVQVYMAYMDLTENSAIFTSINKNTQELYHEAIPFDLEHAQKMSDKGANIIHASLAGELLPRIAQSEDYFECKYCSWHIRCWEQPS